MELRNQKPVVNIEALVYSYESSGKQIQIPSFHVREGDCIAVLGPNGSGKTTFFKLLLRILTPKKGRILVFGRKKYSVYPVIGFVPAFIHTFFSTATVLEEIQARIKDVNRKDSYDWIMEYWHPHFTKSPFLLSLGEQQRLVLDLLELQDPQILLLDEPGKGLDPVQKHEFHDRLEKWISQGKTIFLATHFASTTMHCNKLLVFEESGESLFYETRENHVIQEVTIRDTSIDNVVLGYDATRLRAWISERYE